MRGELQRVWDAAAGPYRGLLRCVYDSVNKAVWLAPARPKQGASKALMDALGLAHPHDRNGKVLRDRLCSAALEDALAEYRWEAGGWVWGGRAAYLASDFALLWGCMPGMADDALYA